MEDPKPTISASEMASRRRAVEAADASIRLSGMSLSARLTALNEEYIAGRIEADELDRTVLGWHGLKPQEFRIKSPDKQ